MTSSVPPSQDNTLPLKKIFDDIKVDLKFSLRKQGGRRRWTPELNLTEDGRGYAFPRNKVIQVGDVKYFTDSVPRVIRAIGRRHRSAADRNNKAQRAVGKLGKAGDVGGHASQGGPGDGINMVPMADDTNKSGGEWNNKDAELKLHLKKRIQVYEDITLHYADNTTLRPSRFSSEVNIAGQEPRMYEIENS